MLISLQLCSIALSNSYESNRTICTSLLWHRFLVIHKWWSWYANCGHLNSLLLIILLEMGTLSKLLFGITLPADKNTLQSILDMADALFYSVYFQWWHEGHVWCCVQISSKMFFLYCHAQFTILYLYESILMQKSIFLLVYQIEIVSSFLIQFTWKACVCFDLIKWFGYYRKKITKNNYIFRIYFLSIQKQTLIHFISSLLS
jgi:hypothetical protein